MKEALTIVLVSMWAALAFAQAELPRQAPLRSLGGISKVVVVSSHEQLDAKGLRAELEEKLRRHGVLPPWNAGSRAPELLLQIARHQGRSEAGCSHYTYLVTLTLREPVVLEREPNVVVFGDTWEAMSWTSRFNRDLPPEAVADVAHELLNSFLGKYLSELDMEASGVPELR